MRHLRIVTAVLLLSSVPAMAQLSAGVRISQPGLSIGITVQQYPEFVRVPDYPVYYAPRLQANYFFYDGLYWVYQRDNWYSSTWYDGPWWLMEPDYVPLYILRIPVRYYRSPPNYFRGWGPDQAPRWGEHWGSQWQQRRGGWDRWDRRVSLAPAPLPDYQRQYSQNRYPSVEQQRTLVNNNYRYQPRDAEVIKPFRQQAAAPQPVRREQPVAPADRPEPAARPAPTAPPRSNSPNRGGTGDRVAAPAPIPAPPQERRSDQERQQQSQQQPEQQQQERARGEQQGKGRKQDKANGDDNRQGKDRNDGKDSGRDSRN
jgi:hypothetical protein